MKPMLNPNPLRVLLYFLLFILSSGSLTAQDEHNDQVGIRVKNRRAEIISDKLNIPQPKDIRIIDETYYFKKLDLTKKIGDKTYHLIFFPGTKSQAVQQGDDNKSAEGVVKKEFSAIDLDNYFWIDEEDLKDELITPVYKTYQSTVFLSALTAPFKARLKLASAKGDFMDGSFNVGTTIGYRFTKDSKTISYIAPVVFGEVTTLNFTSANNTDIKDLNTTQSGSGYSYGFGVLFKFSGITPGVVFGFDHAFGDNGKGFVYQDKMWVSFSLNFDFGKKKETENKKQ